MNSRGLFALSTMIAIGMDHARYWDDDHVTEKSNLPKKEMMPLTDEEKAMLESLSGKAKKDYVKELRSKYDCE